MNGDIFDGFAWHSSIGIDDTLAGNKKFVTRLANTERVRTAFVKVAGGSNLLIHRTTKAIWQVSPDKASIQPIFPTDILTAEDVADLTEEEG